MSFMPLQKNGICETILEKLVVAQVVKKFPVFHETCYLRIS